MSVPKSFSVKTGKGKPSFLMFQKAVLQAFGGKSNEWDAPTTEAKFEQLYNRADVQTAIQMLTGEIPTDAVVLERILQGEEIPNTETEHPTQAYHALVALTAYKEAEGGDFTTSLPYEIDGKTNGTAHAILGFMETGKDGDSLQDYLERVYTNTSRFRSFGEFVEGGGKDHYVLFGNGLTEAMNDITADIEAGIAEDDEMSVADLKALNTLVSQNPNNSTVKRGLVKQALMVLIYGASPYNVTRVFANSVIEEIYDTISVDLTQLDEAKKQYIN